MASQCDEKLESVASSPTAVAVGSVFDQAVSLESGSEQRSVREPLSRWYWRLWSSSAVQPPAKDLLRLQLDEESRRPKTRTLDRCADGYPQLAVLQSSDCSFMQYRGFGYVHARVLLSLQHEIAALERKLDELDEFDSEDVEGDKNKLFCIETDNRESTAEDIGEDFPFRRTRPQILGELRRKLLDYDEMLLKSKEMANLQRPSNRDWQSVRDWIFDNNPLVDDEKDFILKKEDIVTLRTGRECAGFDSFIERALSRAEKILSERCGCDIVKRLFVTPELREKTSTKELHFYAPARIDKLVNVVITVIIFVLLVLPVVAMYELSNLGARASPFEAIGILIVFTLLFGTCMSGLTKATRQELFAASAAYCAVLVVFISNFSTQSVMIA